MSRLATVLLFAFIVAIFSACQEGLDPSAAQKAVIYGTVRFENEFPPDSLIKDIRVVAFKSYPPADIIGEVLSGEAIFSESLLPISGDTADYKINVESLPARFKYIAVARQYGTLFEWDAIGVYTDDYINFSPLEIYASKGIGYRADIKVDFNNRPPQPF